MLRIDRHPLARQDLIEIWHYTAERWGEVQADHYLRTINAAAQRLGENPQAGLDYGHLRTGLRRCSVERHRIYYYVKVRTIEIVRVLHVSMDADAQLPDQGS